MANSPRHRWGCGRRSRSGSGPSDHRPSPSTEVVLSSNITSWAPGTVLLADKEERENAGSFDLAVFVEHHLPSGVVARQEQWA
eukprot:3481631-Lingulodinium_polyedra.AAC.1